MSDKQIVLEAVRRMSESATLDEIREAVAILAAIRRGEAAADSGKVVPHEEVKRRAAAKSKKKATKKSGEIRLTPVDSSMISAVGYDAENKELIAVFNSGAMWRYRGVTQKVYKELVASSSKGSYMRSCIIGMYPEYQVRR